MGNSPDFTQDHNLMKVYMTSQISLHATKTVFDVQDVKFPLSTSGIMIIDQNKNRVKLAGGNWSGAHMKRHCVDGLQCRPMKDLAEHIRYKFGMNTIRLTYSLQMIFQDNVIPKEYLSANPQLIGKTAMEIFDKTIQVLTEVGLMVILNCHTSKSQWCCSNKDGDGLWWSREWPEYLFFESVEMLAKRYKHNPRVIGMDLRNELRKAHGVSATWGDQNPRTDWKRAAKISGEIALKHAPHWLIFVAGLGYQLDLTPIYNSPLHYSVPNKLVYSGHFYGFSWPIPSWKMVTYDQFKKKLFNDQTFVRALGYPYLLGQFGNNQRDIPWKYLMRYLKETGIDWTYWALDGFKCDKKQDQTYGVFTNDFSTARHPDMLKDMLAVARPTNPNSPNIKKQQIQEEIEESQIIERQSIKKYQMQYQ